MEEDAVLMDFHIELTNTRQLYSTLYAWTREEAAEVRIASYSLGEEMARMLGMLKREGRVTHLVCHLSRQAMQKSREELVSLRLLCDELYLCHIHAKILLVRYADGRTRTLITSQNATRGSSYECFLEHHALWVWELLTDALIKLPSYQLV